MAPRRAQPTKVNSTAEDQVSGNESEELDFLASQQSSGSDDHEIELAIAEKFAAKKKEKQQKYLNALHKQLDRDLSGVSEDVKTTTGKMLVESLFSDFLQRYAASEDDIRDLLNQILAEQQKILTFANQRIAANVEDGKRIEAGHISGLSRAKGACTDFQEVINMIVPQTV